MNAPTVTGAVQRPGRGRVFDSIVDAIVDTPLVRLQRLPQRQGEQDSAGKVIAAIMLSFAERYLSTALFEGI